MIDVKDISTSDILLYTVHVYYSTIFDDTCSDTLYILSKSDDEAKAVAENQIKLHYQSVSPEINDIGIVRTDFVGYDGYLGGIN